MAEAILYPDRLEVHGNQSQEKEREPRKTQAILSLEPLLVLCISLLSPVGYEIHVAGQDQNLKKKHEII